MTDFAKLVLTSDSTDLVTSTGDLDRLAAASGKTETAVKSDMAGISTAMGRVPTAAGKIAPAMNTASGSISNMTAQFNDIAVMMAAGQNPLQLAMQQGMQLTQVMGPMGAAGAVSALKGAFLSMLNPMNLIVLGSIAAGAAMFQWLTGAGETARTLDDILDSIEGNLNAIKAADKSLSAEGATELAKKYGLIDETLLSIIESQKKIATIDAFADIRESAEATRDILADGIFTSDSMGMAALLNVTERLGGSVRGTINPAISEMSALLADIESAATFTDAAQGMAELYALIMKTNPGLVGLNAEQRDLVTNMGEAALKARELTEQINQGNAKAGATASGMGTVSIKTGEASSAAGVLSSMLGSAAVQASALAAYMSALPGAIAGFQAQAHAASAGLSAMKMGYDAAAVSAAEFRAQQEAAAGMLTASEGPGMKSAAAAVDQVVTAYETATAISAEFTDAQKAAAEAAAKAAAALVGGGGAGAAGALDEFTAASMAATDATLELSSVITSELTAAMDGLIDWTVSGFEGGWQAIGDSFESMWQGMVSYALKNQINSMVGLNADGTFSAGSAGQGFTDALTGSLSGGIGGFFDIAGNAAAAGINGVATLGSTLGALVGPLGLVIGLFSAFKTTTTLLAQGLEVSIDGMELLATEFSTVKKTSFFGLISSTKTTTNAVDAEAQAQLEAIYSDISANVTDAASVLGVASDAFDDFAYDFSVSTKGMSDEEAAQAIANEFAQVEDAMAELALAGSDVVIPLEGAGVYLQQLADSLTAVNGASELLGTSMLDASIASGVLADEIVAVFGGLDAYIASTGFYFDTFYSAEEQVAALTSKLQADLAALGIMDVPETTEQYRALVDAANAAGDPILAAELMALSDEFVNILGIAEETTAALAQVDPNDYKSLFDYQKAMYGVTGSNTNVAPAVPASNGGQGSTGENAVVEMKAMRAEMAAMRAEQRDLNIQIVANTNSTRVMQNKWDTDGLTVNVA